MLFYKDKNDQYRQLWLKKSLLALPSGYRILDAGAGELRNRQYCKHLDYVSQDFCQYKGAGDGAGLQVVKWDTSKIDLVCDITAIPEKDASFDVIICTEVFEHVPDPLLALNEFSRLLKPDGLLILTAPFASMVHMAPYHYYSGFSRYWYEYHLPLRGFSIEEITANGDWFDYCQQEIMRLGNEARQRGDWSWPLAYGIGALAALYFKIRGGSNAEDLACFGWQCISRKK